MIEEERDANNYEEEEKDTLMKDEGYYNHSTPFSQKECKSMSHVFENNNLNKWILYFHSFSYPKVLFGVDAITDEKGVYKICERKNEENERSIKEKLYLKINERFIKHIFLNEGKHKNEGKHTNEGNVETRLIYELADFSMSNMLEYMKAKALQLTLWDVVRIFTPLFETLKFIHEECLVSHLDISPKNFVCKINKDSFDFAFIDFGSSEKHEKGVRVRFEKNGTGKYMSPKREKSEKIEPLSEDLFAMGVCLSNFIELLKNDDDKKIMEIFIKLCKEPAEEKEEPNKLIEQLNNINDKKNMEEILKKIDPYKALDDIINILRDTLKDKNHSKQMVDLMKEISKNYKEPLMEKARSICKIKTLFDLNLWEDCEKEIENYKKIRNSEKKEKYNKHILRYFKIVCKLNSHSIFKGEDLDSKLREKIQKLRLNPRKKNLNPIKNSQAMLIFYKFKFNFKIRREFENISKKIENLKKPESSKLLPRWANFEIDRIWLVSLLKEAEELFKDGKKAETKDKPENELKPQKKLSDLRSKFKEFLEEIAKFEVEESFDRALEFLTLLKLLCSFFDENPSQKHEPIEERQFRKILNFLDIMKEEKKIIDKFLNKAPNANKLFEKKLKEESYKDSISLNIKIAEISFYRGLWDYFTNSTKEQGEKLKKIIETQINNGKIFVNTRFYKYLLLTKVDLIKNYRSEGSKENKKEEFNQIKECYLKFFNLGMTADLSSIERELDHIEILVLNDLYKGCVIFKEWTTAFDAMICVRKNSEIFKTNSQIEDRILFCSKKLNDTGIKDDNRLKESQIKKLEIKSEEYKNDFWSQKEISTPSLLSNFMKSQFYNESIMNEK